MKHTYCHDIFKLSVTSEIAAAAFSLLSMKLCEREVLPSTDIFSEAFIDADEFMIATIQAAHGVMDMLIDFFEKSIL